MKTIEDLLEEYHIDDIDLELMKTAFTHGSYRSLYPNADDYQRLEFLGDAIIDSIVSGRLFKKGKFTEGDLTELRSQLVKEKPLAALFDKMQLFPLVRHNLTNISTKIKSDVVEAFFGCLYLTNGLKESFKVWNLIMEKTGFEKDLLDNFFNHHDNESKDLTPEEIEEKKRLTAYYDSKGINRNQNAKNVLQELFQAYYKPLKNYPKYFLIEERGPDHSKTFKIVLKESIKLLGKTYRLKVEAEAKKQNRAEIKAAEKACDIIYLSYNKI